MGWSYRKAVNIGPFRVNLGKSGVGYSVGGGGFRTGVNAKGRRYSRVSIPGTGLSYTSSKKESAPGGCLGLLMVGVAVLGAIGLMLFLYSTNGGV